MQKNDAPKLTKEQAAIIGLYTGIACGPFSDVHKLAEELLGRPVWTHEFPDKDVRKEMKEAVKPLFLSICFVGGDS